MPTAEQMFRPWSSISPYEIRPVSGRPIRAAETANPLMNVSANPACSIRRAEWASKQHGITCRPGRASTSRRAAALDGARIPRILPRKLRAASLRRAKTRRRVYSGPPFPHSHSGDPMREAVIVEAVRTPIARGKPGVGDLSAFHAGTLLSKVQDAVIERAGVDPAEIEQVVGGCVTQAGEQSNNITRVAWLNRNKGWRTGGTTVDTQCGSGQQANPIISAFIRSGSIDAGSPCGVQVMSHVSLGANVIHGPGYFQPPEWGWDTAPDQFTHAERIAQNRGLTREDVERFALESQARALRASSEGRFAREILPIDAPVLGQDGQPTGDTQRVTHDQGIRPSTLDGLAKLKPMREGGVPTPGNTSQISDGAAAVPWMSADKA